MKKETVRSIENTANSSKQIRFETRASLERKKKKLPKSRKLTKKIEKGTNHVHEDRWVAIEMNFLVITITVGARVRKPVTRSWHI